MSTRNLTMVINRKYASESELGFAQNPVYLSDKSCVNMYLHHDGYPEWQGVQLANWCNAYKWQDPTRIGAKLVHDMYYDSCYLYPDVSNIAHQYTYIIWTGKRDNMWISCYDQYSSENVFVLPPEKIIEKYYDKRFAGEDGIGYTDWNHKLNTKIDG